MKQNLIIMDYAVRILVMTRLFITFWKNKQTNIKEKLEIIPDIHSLFR